MVNIINDARHDPNSKDAIELLNGFYPYAKKYLKLKRDFRIILKSDEANAKLKLGKTGEFSPGDSSIIVYVTNRHCKDVVRSAAHELVHASQYERGEFDKSFSTAPGYAQKNTHLRELEREAYELGNLCFRDWEDEVKSQKGIFENKEQKQNRILTEYIVSKKNGIQKKN